MTVVTLLFLISQLFYAALGSVTTTAASQGNCRHGWINFRDSCYLFSHSVLTWPDAEEACEVLHSTLATVQTEEEQAFLKAHLNDIHKTTYPHYAYWIDGNDLEVKNEWQWSSIDKPLNYTDWAPGDPHKRANEDCLILWGPYHFQMSDYFCYIRKRFICQQRMAVAPTANPVDGWIAFG